MRNTSYPSCYAIVYDTGTFLFFVDGILIDSLTYTSFNPTQTWTLYIGGNAYAKGNASTSPNSGLNGFVGTIDEFRISDGIARWTRNFTPPTEPYERAVAAYDERVINNIIKQL